MHSSDPSSDVVSLSVSDPDAKLDIESMTGRGIKHLCDELRELKEAANQDLQRNIFANSSSFLRSHISQHIELRLNIRDHIHDVPSPPSELEAHINDVSDKLDIFISENMIDEALHLLESADAHYHSIQLEDNSNCENEIMLYNSMISEKKSMLIQQLTQIAENRRTAGPELQRVLAALCSLGDSQLAIHLLLEYYHLRIVTGTNNLQWSKSSLDEIYIRELARFVFSMISQAARNFVMLFGETSIYASELMLWACEETKSFVTCLDKYVKCNSTMSAGLSSAIKAVKFAVLYCSLLENQNLVLRPYLVEYLCPCMEEVLNTHINHFKKVIAIFSASDPWILEKYLVSGVFGEAGSSSSTFAVGEQPGYCLLTTSGRKVLTLLQAIVEDMSPLVALQMGSLVIGGLMNLFTEYTTILERVLTYETSATEPGSSRIKLAESLPQQVSILANLSTLVQFLSTMVKGIFSNNNHMDSLVKENHSIVHQQQELDDFLLFIEEGSNKLRNVFCQQLILSSTYHSHEIFSAVHYDDQFDANTINNPMPSGIFQVLFLELRKIKKLDEENEFEVNWLMGLLRELMESMFIWVSKNKEIRETTEEHMSLQTHEAKQFILDVQFLVEIGMYGGYFSNDPLLLLTLMKSTFSSAGLDPFKDVDNDDWAIDAATKTIQKLLEIEKTSLHPKEPVVTIKEELHEQENQINQSACECNFSEEDMNSSDNIVDAVDVKEAEVAQDESEAIDAETTSLDIAFSPVEGSSEKRDYVDTDTSNLRKPTINTMQLENTDFEKAVDAENDELTPTSSMGEVGQNSEETKSKSDE
ncbi:Exocyst component Exo84, C-terminal [Sesbania bispinosa]|nr:Exocyst component Exo84, C-terminal [Sesbania bispinosa]